LKKLHLLIEEKRTEETGDVSDIAVINNITHALFNKPNIIKTISTPTGPVHTLRLHTTNRKTEYMYP
jgi:hypothetical protein